MLHKILCILGLLITCALGQGRICDTVIFEKKVTVTCSTFYDTKKLYSVSRYTDGKRNGIQQEWHRNGTLSSFYSCLMGCIMDTVLDYHDNGKIKQVVNYSNCKQNGEKIAFSSSGDTISKKKYLLGKPIGLHKEFFTKNKPKELTNYDYLGRKQGVSLRWREDGTLKDSSVYKDGEYVEIREYFDNGTLRLHEWSSTPLITDSAVYYAPDGKNKSVVKNGNGEVLMFSEDRKEIWGMKIENGKTLWTRPVAGVEKK